MSVEIRTERLSPSHSIFSPRASPTKRSGTMVEPLTISGATQGLFEFDRSTRPSNRFASV
ncbi:hypothetical protein ACVKN2_003733 [Paenibacillus sp. PvR018]